MTGYMTKMNDIRKREIELFKESYRLSQAGFEVTKNNKTAKKYFNQCKNIHNKQDEVWKKKCFFENYLKEMEKLKNGKN